MNANKNGKIITFYSYKGGTGRSMALANTAWILASHGKKVLVIDWDLEAPGLHRYFKPFLIDPELEYSEGLIDFAWDMSMRTLSASSGPSRKTKAKKKAEPDISSLPRKADKKWVLDTAEQISEYVIPLQWPIKRQNPLEGVIHFIPAGRQGNVYAERVNLFDWDRFYKYQGGGVLLERVRKYLKSQYDYVLIDSRTGVSDTAGICTVQMPDALVVLFTLNNQSIAGAKAVGLSVLKQHQEREQAAEKGPLTLTLGSERRFEVYPVPTRLDQSEKDKLTAGLEMARKEMSPLLHYMSAHDQQKYWDDVEVQYVPYYSYEEVLAVFGEKPGRKTTLLASMERLTYYLSGHEIDNLAPFEETARERIVDKYTRKQETKVVITGARDSNINVSISRKKSGWYSFSSYLYAFTILASLALAIWSLLPSTRSASNKIAVISDTTATTSLRTRYFSELYEEGRMGFANTNLSNLDFSDMDLRHIDFSFSTLNGASFFNASLDSVNLANADLRNVSFGGADLRYAILTGADLTGADLRGASFYEAQLEGAIFDSTTQVGDSTNFTGARISIDQLNTIVNPGFYVFPDGNVLDRDTSDDSPVKPGLEGFIWIGDYDRVSQRWTESNLWVNYEDRQKFSADPGTISSGDVFWVQGNLSVREGMPENNASYYRAQTLSGVINNSSRIVVLGRPEGINRPSKVQYWARVRLVE